MIRWELRKRRTLGRSFSRNVARVVVACSIGVPYSTVARAESGRWPEPNQVPPAPGTAAMGDSLFWEGRAALSAGNINAALEKFDASQELHPSPGTLLNIALCHRLLGHTATAWATYRAAEVLARKRGRTEVEEEARTQVALLEPELSYLTVIVSEKIPGLLIESNGKRLQAGAFGAPLPMDPGVYHFRASAPDREPWSQSVEIRARSSVRMTIPPLTHTATAPQYSAWPFIMGGAGIAALGAATTFGILAKVEHDRALSHCDDNGCSSEAYAAENKASQFADTSSVLFPIGAALTITGAVWLVLESNNQDSKNSSAHGVRYVQIGLTSGPMFQCFGAFQ